MNIRERLINYLKIDTQSDPASTSVPTTQKQFDLARLLEKELKEMGLSDVRLDEHCYVYACLKSNVDKPTKTVGFIAHMDTSPDFNGKNVNPRIIENYDGKDIDLNGNLKIRVSEFPQFKNYIGNSIMVTDGTSLLGADDKAGIASIMAALEYLVNHPEIKHGDIKVGFTPDEEVGRGTVCFDVENFGCDFAYTMDGDEVSVVADENFNAASCLVKIKGLSIHPGSAKDKMINAINLAMEFHGMLPANMRPEHTEKREGFNHITDIEGDVENAKLYYIIRNHDLATFNRQIDLFNNIKDFINSKYGKDLVEVEVSMSYKNMYEVLKDRPEIVEVAKKAMVKAGLNPSMESIRGGTDGANLTFKNLPCPNLGTGGGNFHGPYEYLVLDQLDKAVEVIVNIASEVVNL